MSSVAVGVDRIQLLAKVCRESYWSFVKNFWTTVPGSGIMQQNWHMKLLCDEMQAVAERVFRGQPREHDLLINLPPGTSKTSLVSILFQPWTWTRMPTARHMSASHTDALVLDISSKSRWVIKSDLYKACFPDIQLSNEQDAKGFFRNTHGGERFTCTAGGKSPTGRHSHFLVFDDLIDPKKVRSVAEIKAAEEFVTQIAPSRKVDKEVSVTIQVTQRLSPEDTSAVQLKMASKEDAIPLRHVCLPAEIEDEHDANNVKPPELIKNYVHGLLDPKRLSRRVLKEFRAALGEYGYSSQFRQDPVSLGSGRFQPHYFNQRVRCAPYNCKRIFYIDRASSRQGVDGTRTAGVLMGKHESGFYIEYVLVGQWEPNERNQRLRAALLMFRQRYGPKNEPEIWIEREGGSSGRDAWKSIARALAGFNVREDRVTGSKEVRCEPWASQLASMNIYIVDNGESLNQGKADWDIEDFIMEHLSWPMGRWTDQIDACCFCKGTRVFTKKGEVPIEEVLAGDEVLTRQGYKEVEWSGQSGVTNKIVSVLFSNGSILTGTFEHLVWTLGGKFIMLGELSENDRVLSYEDFQWQNKMSQESVPNVVIDFLDCEEQNAVPEDAQICCCGTGKEESTSTKKFSTKGFPSKEGFLMEDISKECGMEKRSFSTEQSGWTSMAPSPISMIFITKTETLLTIKLTISSALAKSSTDSIIEKVTGHLSSLPILSGLEMELKPGIRLMKGENGIESMDRRFSKTGSQETISALTVGRHLNLPVMEERGRGQDIALELATTVIAGIQERRRNLKGVLCAKRNSLDSIEQNVAQESAERNIAGPIQVYDLKVKDTHEFFANGILVHNSGAFNLHANSKQIKGPRVVSIGGGKRKGLRITVATKDELANLMDQDSKCLLVSLTNPDPIGNVDMPMHGITHKLGYLAVQFAPLEPANMQEEWNNIIPEYNSFPKDLIMTRDHGKKLWAFFMKKWDYNPDCIVLADDGDGKALSVAYAVADALRMERDSTVCRISGEDNSMKGDKPPIQHVYDMMRASKGLVYGGQE